jgi:hypothetical protein
MKHEVNNKYRLLQQAFPHKENYNEIPKVSSIELPSWKSKEINIKCFIDFLICWLIKSNTVHQNIENGQGTNLGYQKEISAKSEHAQARKHASTACFS